MPYLELKSTRAQLIQSEKKASLGEPSTGYFNEIQNPLNLVTNFSEVNRESLVEMKDKIEKSNVDIVKYPGGELKVKTKESNGTKPITLL